MIEGWKQITINDLGKVVTGNTPPKKDPANYGGKYPFIKPTDMDIDRRHVTTWEENYSEKAFKRYHRSYIPPKATGVVTIGTVGEKIFQADQWCFTNQSVNVVIPNEELYDPDFVFYILKINLLKVENANPGTASGRHHVSKSNFCAIKIWVPESKDTQRKIAGILSAYDDLIENNLKRIKLLEEKAQLTYEEWFVRMKFPGHETTPMNEETGLPEGWEEKKVGDITKTSSGGTPSRKKEIEYYENGTIPWVRTGELKNFILTDAEFKITESGLKNSSAKLFPKNTVLLAMYGNTIGETSFVTKEVCSNQACCAFLVKNKTFLSYFLHQYLLYHKDYILNYRMGAAQENISQSIIQNIKIIYPLEDLLINFEEDISKNYKSIEGLIKQNQLLKEARDILLPRLMTGMIDVEALDLSAFEQEDQEEMLMAAEPEMEFRK